MAGGERTGISTEVQHRFCPLHSSYHYTNSTPILPRPPLLPETRYSYSLAQIPVCTTLWYESVHTIPRFSAYLFVPSSGTNWCIPTSQFQCIPFRTKQWYQLVHTNIAVSVHTFSYQAVVPTSAYYLMVST